MANEIYSEDASVVSVEPKESKSIAQKAKTAADLEPTVLGKLTATIREKVSRPDVYIDVPERKGVKLRISPNITQQQIKNWRKSAGDDTRAGMDATKFAAWVIGNTTQGIIFDDAEVYDEDGYELNFASPAVLSMTSQTRPIPDAVRSFFALDPHVESAALAILDASGYSDTIEATDPSKGSSTN